MKTFIARQPMIDINGEIIGYELLFRNSMVNQAEITDNYTATLKVIKDLIINFNVKEMSNNKRMFINFNDETILQGAPDLFMPETLVIELLEDTSGSDELVEKLMAYKDKGYLIALDDFLFKKGLEALIALADIIKLDFFDHDRQAVVETVNSLKPYRKILLAEKVETEEDVNFAKALGCTIFQGYFFQKPKIFEGKEVVTMPTVYLELLKILNEPVVDFEALSSVILRDSSLTLSLLKLLNSAAYYSNKRVTSVKIALIRLGINESKKLILVNMLKNFIAEGTLDEIVNISLKRAKQAELLSEKFNLIKRKDELFIVGLLSLINIIMKRQMTDILSNVPLNGDVIDALLGKENQLSKVIDLIILYEMGEINGVEVILTQRNLDIETFNRMYIEATMWADELLRE
ncbi:MAG: HDOD domain-containing protein [Clostridia bacterium]|nr:HDOD domain-containing protein [Clostridia bacterium]